MAEGMTALCDRAEKSGMAVMVENVDQSPDDMRRFFELEPRAKFHLDVGHANLLCANGANIYHFIDQFKDRLYHVHVHDNRGGHDQHGDLHLGLGMGNIDWPRVVKALKTAGYNKTVTFEVFGKNRSTSNTAKSCSGICWKAYRASKHAVSRLCVAEVCERSQSSQRGHRGHRGRHRGLLEKRLT